LLPEVLPTADEDDGLETSCSFRVGEHDDNNGEVAAVVGGRRGGAGGGGGFSLTLFKARFDKAVA